jgi:ABC-type nitrate/sulfonate/bicarbonate transport system substrate-binding protein
MAVPVALNLNGSAITLSKGLADELRLVDPDGMTRRPRSAAGMARLAQARREAGGPPLTFAAVFPYSIHNYELRAWLASGGVRAGRDVRLVIVPPARMVEKLETGEIDGFCVTAPWNGLAVSRGIGEIALHAAEWWGATPDKVLGFTRDWAERHPATLQAVTRAVLRAAAWADDPANRPTVAAILSRPEFVGTSEAVLRLSLEGAPPLAPGEEATADSDYIVFNRYAASFPWRSHAQWFAAQMMRWGQAPRDLDMAAAAAVYRPDLFRPAAAAVGQAAPLVDAKVEGAHDAAWTLSEATAPLAMRPDTFLGGGVFDPAEANEPV